ncbi:hypothetical protein AC739_19230, partial [Planococcus glaciei]|uniref:hypothetical protein n=1 Tax=Planococcus glaciei TaxID=459472 RepID=UPI0006C1F127
MNCCDKCFMSSEIKSIIRSKKNLGICSFCRTNNTYIYNLTTDEGLDELFNDILNIFRLGTELITDGYSPYKLVSLKDEFEKKWNIFNNLDGNQIHMFLSELLAKNYPDKIPFLTNQVGIVEWMNEN